MAKLYPEHLPESVLADPKRSAERKVYEALSTLSNAFHIFYSVGWVGTFKGEVQDGEADFVIANADYGILIIEVKGGGIGYDSLIDQWTSIDRKGETHPIQDPVAQAMKSKHTLQRKLTSLPGWNNHRFTMGHVVIFPDVIRSSQPLKPDLPNEIMFGVDELNSIESNIIKAFKYFSNYEQTISLGKDNLQRLDGFLGRSFELKTPLGVELNYEDKKLVQLTGQQMQVLDFLQFHRRVAIQGCAGSGKTMLALEKAKRLAEEGMHVLLTCFNYALAEYLSYCIPENVTVKYFHGLCIDFAKMAGLSLAPEKDEETYYREKLPEALMQSVDILGPQFDAIIVDEGQDFDETWWIALSTLLKDNKGIIYIFYDDNQNLYNVSSSFAGLIDTAPIALTINCRNTQAIHDLVAAFHSHPATSHPNVPKGKAPVILSYHGEDDLRKKVMSTLHQLTQEEHVAMSDIVILTPKSNEKSIFKTGTKLGNLSCTMVHPQQAGQIQATSVYKFKGLESLVIILAELDESIHHNLEEVFYVGCSRARTYLIVFIDDMIPLELKNKVNSALKL